jgi:ABC-2 type transport system permease protein
MKTTIINKPIAFFKRDFLHAVSYRFQFMLQLAGIFVSTFMFFFLAKLMGGAVNNKLAPYGGDYFSFVLIGIAFADYLTVSLQSFSSQIRTAQMQGTLEALLVTPTPVWLILFSSSLYNFFFTSLRVVLYLIVGTILFGLNLHITSLAAFFIVLLLTIITFSGIGLISAAFIIVFKQGSPINWLVSTASSLLGGVFYPVTIMSSWIEHVSYLLPITHSLEAMRLILLKGAGLGEISHQLIALITFAAVLLPLGTAAFLHGLKIAKKEGSLIHY